MIDGQTVELTPGMSVVAEIKSDKRRVIDYLLSPIQEYQAEALREIAMTPVLQPTLTGMLNKRYNKCLQELIGVSKLWSTQVSNFTKIDLLATETRARVSHANLTDMEMRGGRLSWPEKPNNKAQYSSVQYAATPRSYRITGWLESDDPNR